MKIMGIDYGDARTGVAISDLLCSIVGSTAVLPSRNTEKLIADIIEKDIEKAKVSELILQPMNGQYELRKKLIELGFSIEKETLAAESFKVYNIMRAAAGERLPAEKEIYYHLPKELFSHHLFRMLLEKKEREFNKIINGQKNSASADCEILGYYTELLSELNKIKSNYIK